MRRGEPVVRVGVTVGHALRGPAGPRRYAQALCDALGELPRVEVVVLPTPSGNAISRRLWDLIGIGLVARRRSVDLIHCTGIYPPLIARQPVVLTVHDLAIRRLPGAFPPVNRSVGWLLWSFLARRADRYIAISEATRNDLLRWLGPPPERVSVVHHGVGGAFREVVPADVDRVRRTHDVRAEYFLAVGTIEPRKNLARILDALRMARANGRAAHLVVVGAPGWNRAQVREQLASATLGSAVHFLGRVPDEDLAALYGGAVGLVYPSLYEGFGLPVLEAMACGCPVITSARGGLAEAAGDAAQLVDPLSVEDISVAMQSLLTDSNCRARLIERGRLHAARFTWRRAAEQSVEVYRRVLEGDVRG